MAKTWPGWTDFGMIQTEWRGAATDVGMPAEIRSRGVFAGVSAWTLPLSVVEPDRTADRSLYAADVNRGNPPPHGRGEKAVHKTSGD
jgi:hypothetical protein